MGRSERDARVSRVCVEKNKNKNKNKNKKSKEMNKRGINSNNNARDRAVALRVEQHASRNHVNVSQLNSHLSFIFKKYIRIF